MTSEGSGDGRGEGMRASQRPALCLFGWGWDALKIFCLILRKLSPTLGNGKARLTGVSLCVPALGMATPATPAAPAQVTAAGGRTGWGCDQSLEDSSGAVRCGRRRGLLRNAGWSPECGDREVAQGPRHHGPVGWRDPFLGGWSLREARRFHRAPVALGCGARPEAVPSHAPAAGG